MASNYSRGASKERHAMSELTKLGCSYVARIAGSHSEFDVVGVNNRYTYMVQSKSTKSMPVKPLSVITRYRKDIEAISKLHLPPNNLKEVWVYAFRKGAVKINVFPEELYRI